MPAGLRSPAGIPMRVNAHVTSDCLRRRTTSTVAETRSSRRTRARADAVRVAPRARTRSRSTPKSALHPHESGCPARPAPRRPVAGPGARTLALRLPRARRGRVGRAGLSAGRPAGRAGTGKRSRSSWVASIVGRLSLAVAAARVVHRCADTSTGEPGGRARPRCGCSSPAGVTRR